MYLSNSIYFIYKTILNKILLLKWNIYFAWIFIDENIIILKLYKRSNIKYYFEHFVIIILQKKTLTYKCIFHMRRSNRWCGINYFFIIDINLKIYNQEWILKIIIVLIIMPIFMSEYYEILFFLSFINNIKIGGILNKLIILYNLIILIVLT